MFTKITFIYVHIYIDLCARYRNFTKFSVEIRLIRIVLSKTNIYIYMTCINYMVSFVSIKVYLCTHGVPRRFDEFDNFCPVLRCNKRIFNWYLNYEETLVRVEGVDLYTRVLLSSSKPYLMVGTFIRHVFSFSRWFSRA